MPLPTATQPHQRQRANPVICLSGEHPDYPDLETGWYIAVGQGLGFVALYRAGEDEEGMIVEDGSVVAVVDEGWRQRCLTDLYDAQAQL